MRRVSALRVTRQPARRARAQWRRANLSKYSAHVAVQRALTIGRLHKPACEVCGAATVDANHDRYDRPPVVCWLCRTHHTKLHYYGEDMFQLGAASGDTDSKRQE